MFSVIRPPARRRFWPQQPSIRSSQRGVCLFVCLALALCLCLCLCFLLACWHRHPKPKAKWPPSVLCSRSHILALAICVCSHPSTFHSCATSASKRYSKSSATREKFNENNYISPNHILVYYQVHFWKHSEPISQSFLIGITIKKLSEVSAPQMFATSASESQLPVTSHYWFY